MTWKTVLWIAIIGYIVYRVANKKSLLPGKSESKAGGFPKGATGDTTGAGFGGGLGSTATTVIPDQPPPTRLDSYNASPFPKTPQQLDAMN